MKECLQQGAACGLFRKWHKGLRGITCSLGSLVATWELMQHLRNQGTPQRVWQSCVRYVSFSLGCSVPEGIPVGERWASIYKSVTFAKNSKYNKQWEHLFTPVLPVGAKLFLCILHPINTMWIYFIFGKVYGFYLYSKETTTKDSPPHINPFILTVQCLS